MKKINTTLEIPEEAYLALSSMGYTKDRIAREAREILAAYLFKNGSLSLGKASELAGLRISPFMDLLTRLEIPVIDYDEEEMEAEFQAAKEL